MSTGTETKVKLSGVLEAMGMALPQRGAAPRQSGLSITDTRLPVGFADDEFDDEVDRFMAEGFGFDEPMALGSDEPMAQARPYRAVVGEPPPHKAQVTEPPHYRMPTRVAEPGEAAGGRNQGAWAKDHTEVHPLPLHRVGRRSNPRVRTYSVAYYRSEHALATGTYTEGGQVFTEPSTPVRRPVDHLDAIGYRGRHRWFKG